MDKTARERSARWRERRRLGAVSVTVDVLPVHRRALECMGLIGQGDDLDPAAVARAVARVLDAAPAIKLMGQALYPDWPETEEPHVNGTASPDNSGENEG